MLLTIVVPLINEAKSKGYKISYYGNYKYNTKLGWWGTFSAPCTVEIHINEDESLLCSITKEQGFYKGLVYKFYMSNKYSQNIYPIKEVSSLKNLKKYYNNERIELFYYQIEETENHFITYNSFVNKVIGKKCRTSLKSHWPGGYTREQIEQDAKTRSIKCSLLNTYN